MLLLTITNLQIINTCVNAMLTLQSQDFVSTSLLQKLGQKIPIGILSIESVTHLKEYFKIILGGSFQTRPLGRSAYCYLISCTFLLISHIHTRKRFVFKELQKIKQNKDGVSGVDSMFRNSHRRSLALMYGQ